MTNKTVKAIGVFVVLILAAIFVLTLTIDGLIKSSIEENSSELLQTVVTVDEVDVSLFSGKGDIIGFKVQNPQDFSEQPAINIQDISIKVNLMSLLKDQIVINEIIVKSPELYFEQKGIGANLKTLNDNMDLAFDEPSETTMIIDYLHIEDGVVTVSTTIDRERMAEANFSEFTLTDIGRDGNNTIKQSVRQILEPLFQKAITEALKSGVTEQVKGKVQDLFNN
ncbi:MAG TPA: hypothetical protein VFM80_06295 [Gracilimonas sp.]|uniref:hypothetical protein n=1 Tax=Gracilimonas sp. TaxID=1974203 RepID=UPI002D81A898|nr:hypothetical protein [Gracilimonas sp.]